MPRLSMWFSRVFIVISAFMFPATVVQAEEVAGPRCEPSHVESGIEGYGTIVSFRPGQRIVLADFALTPVSSGARPEFEARQQGAAVAIQAAAARNEPVEFELPSGRYVLELGHTVLYRRPIADDELVIWPQAEYRARTAR